MLTVGLNPVQHPGIDLPPLGSVAELDDVPPLGSVAELDDVPPLPRQAPQDRM